MHRTTKMGLKKYIKNKEVNHFTVYGTEVFVKDPITNNVSAKKVVNSIFEKVPRHLMRNVESIYIGNFDYLNDRDIQGIYENSAIFVTNQQEDEEDLFDDILHEVAHSVEELYSRDLYEDGRMEKEFLAKRKNLWLKLKNQGLETELSYFLNPEFEEKFDSFLHYEVGYQTLDLLASNIFHSPYAATSLREYFADGFEAFFMREDIPRLKSLSPVLFSKITNLMEN